MRTLPWIRVGAACVLFAVWVGGQARWGVDGWQRTSGVNFLSLALRLLVDPHGGCDDLVGSAVVDLISFAVLAASCLDPGGYPPIDNGGEEDFVQHRFHDCLVVITVELEQFADVAVSSGDRVVDDWPLLSQPIDDLLRKVKLPPDDRSDVRCRCRHIVEPDPC